MFYLPFKIKSKTLVYLYQTFALALISFFQQFNCILLLLLFFFHRYNKLFFNISPM